MHRETLALPKLAAPLRVALLSDLHAGGRFIDAAKVHRVVDAILAERPDIVLLLGDYYNNGRRPDRWRAAGGPMSIDGVADELRRLRAALGVYAVLGNHDWWLDGRRIGAALTAHGIVVLENRAVEVRPGLWLAGVADLMTRDPDPQLALAAVPDDATVLLMTHHPDVFTAVPRRVALTVAGHTHGGQLRLPLVGALVVPSQYGQRFAAGHVVEQGRHLFVTTGVGNSIYPMRFGVPPEIVVLTLTPER